MRVKQADVAFQPVAITLENQEEVIMMYALFNYSPIVAWMQQVAPSLNPNDVRAQLNELCKVGFIHDKAHELLQKLREKC